jgi:starch phosphorylase
MLDRFRQDWQKREIREFIEQKLQGLFGVSISHANKKQLYKAIALVVRDRIMEKWAESEERVHQDNGKKLYYMSMEFLVGRALSNNLASMAMDKSLEAVCKEMGVDLNAIKEVEVDPGLGNGGLGRLAACFLDSLATLKLEGHGCGIRYEYGLFKQKIVDGYQVEVCDSWLEDGHVWEVEKPEESETVRFGGTIKRCDDNGTPRFTHEEFQTVKAVPYDVPVVGHASPVINTLRLWGARPTQHLDMRLFNRGEYTRALAENNLVEVISQVLYPEDSHEQGKTLRLKQQYFFVSAGVQSILRQFKVNGNSLPVFADKTVIHINDTHPSMAIPELMRIFLEEGMTWDEAWGIVTKTFAYTNHTIMSEALEKWPVALFKKILPQIYCIVEEINERFCRALWKVYPEDWQRISEMAIIAHGEVRMAHLAIVGSFSVNGVSTLHTEILQNQVFDKFHAVFPGRFRAITNGITHRRFLCIANPELSALISAHIGSQWVEHPLRLKDFSKTAANREVKEALRDIRRQKKERLAAYIQEHNSITVDVNSIFDVQVKRLHEYKRQLLNVLHIMHLYNQLHDNPGLQMHPRTFIFSAKASAAYHMAKLIIKLINAVGDKINNDPAIANKIKVVFLANYRVSLAELIVPATDVSEQISTAGKEASGTGNMKFMINGALTIGTLDGANVEMSQAVGRDNIYIFGLTAEEVRRIYQSGDYRPQAVAEADPSLKRVLDQLIDGTYSEDRNLFRPLYESLLYGNNGSMADPYLLLKDFDAYRSMHQQVEADYRNPELWWSKAIANIACAGIFSSDRTIEEYNEQIWNLPKHENERMRLFVSN